MIVRLEKLPRNNNGKIDRGKSLGREERGFYRDSVANNSGDFWISFLGLTKHLLGSIFFYMFKSS